MEIVYNILETIIPFDFIRKIILKKRGMPRKI